MVSLLSPPPHLSSGLALCQFGDDVAGVLPCASYLDMHALLQRCMPAGQPVCDGTTVMAAAGSGSAGVNRVQGTHSLGGVVW